MKTAMVVDNSLLMRTVIKDLLEDNGLKVVAEASDSEEAARKFREHKPDLMTLDMILPNGSGAEVLKNILAENSKANILVITETGRGSVDRQMQKIGAKGLLHKPVTDKSMKSALDNIRAGQTFFPDSIRTARPRVLIIDDSVMIRSIIRQIADDSGMEVVGEAEDVKPAIEAYQKTLPDLVFLDIVMPGGTGVEVLKHIMSQNLKTKVLIVTSVGQVKLNQELLQMGAAGVLHKPFTPQELKAMIDKLIAFQPLEPKTIADLNSQQAQGLEVLFKSIREESSQAMEKFIGTAWSTSGTTTCSASSDEFRAMVEQIRKMRAISVQISVQKTMPVIGLLIVPQESADKLATAASYDKSKQSGAEVVTAVLMELANMLTTTTLNVFANTMGHVILSSSPSLIDLGAEDLLTKVPKQLSDMSERILVIKTRFHSAALGAECWTLFFFRIDYIPRLLGA